MFDLFVLSRCFKVIYLFREKYFVEAFQSHKICAALLMELFPKIVLYRIFAKNTIIDKWQGRKYVPVFICFVQIKGKQLSFFLSLCSLNHLSLALAKVVLKRVIVKESFPQFDEIYIYKQIKKNWKGVKILKKVF